MALEMTFRIPASVPYGYIELVFKENSPYDIKRAVLDCDAELMTAVGNAYAKAAGMATIGDQLGAQVVNETSYETPWPSAQEAQEAPPWQSYDQPPAPAWAPQQAPQGPPGVQAPTCQHGQAKLVPAGISKTTNKPYSAFWACQAPRGMTKCQMPKYQG